MLPPRSMLPLAETSALANLALPDATSETTPPVAPSARIRPAILTSLPEIAIVPAVPTVLLALT